MNSNERVLRTLRREETDRVPTFEWAIDKKVIQAISPDASYEDFVYRMGLDALCVDLDYKSEQLDDGIVKDEWGMLKRYSGEAHSFPLDGPVKSMEDLGRYRPPDPEDPARYSTLEAYLERYGRDKAIILHLNDVWSIPSRLMPYDEFMINLYDAPEFIEAVIRMAVDVNIEMAKEAMRRGVKIVYTGDDYAHNGGPFCSPGTFKKLFAPELKRCVQAYKEMGLYVIKHTDGNIMPIIDDILDAGFDCLDPIDPIAGMDLATIKKTYGNRIAIKGNVDCAYTLTFKSVTETIEETRRCIETGAPGGGYILSSSNTIHSAVKPENYIAMLETLKEYGNYPPASYHRSK